MGNKAKKTESNFPWKELLTFLGIIIAAYIGYLGVRSQIEIPIQATQTAEAKLTFVSPITSTTSVLPEQSDTLTPPESASLSTPSTNKILFDTTHQEWGALYGFGDRNIVKALGYEIDLLELPAYSTINTANLSSVIPNEAINFEFSTTDNYPVIGIWLTEAPASTNVSLQSSNEIFETFLWDDGNYTDAAFFQNTAGEWKVSIAPAKAGNYEIQVAAFGKAPINIDLLEQYQIVWFHNAFRSFLPQEQKDIADYLISGGNILIVDNSSNTFNFLFANAFPDNFFQESGAEIRLYSSSFGLGRIAWVAPKNANPMLYQDSASQETSLSTEKIRQILNWLETGSW